ncbi:hypothetical protein H4R22_004323 [Coemansia sp. RSA 1290]|nr:hypothetical protein H4R22_004323 [Coemansia sp. RSA 1290]KAJ2645940.1 hypothetical protein IWW40_005769 [Coemansia sp. RSA 1250]
MSSSSNNPSSEQSEADRPPANLQPLFDSSISLPHAADKQPDSVFGCLPPTSTAPAAAASTTHSRNASYGTSLLDTLNEERNVQRHQRHILPSDSSNGRIQHARAHTLTSASPPGVPTTSASAMLGAHARLGSLSGLGSPPGGLLASSALRSSYSSNSLRASFSRRSPPNEYDVSAALEEGVWGPSRLSNELDLLSESTAQMTVMEPVRHHVRSGSSSSGLMGDALARMRSYSFNNPSELDDPDIDMLHAAARAQNPALAFRKMMARTHARSKTLAGIDDTTVHIGIGGETVSASHSRQPSVHMRTQSIDLEDSVPTRSLWVGNVDPSLSNNDLVALFGKYGRVESLRLLPDKECAFVNFLRVEDAIRAKEDMHAGARIGANTVRVGYGKGEAHASGDAQAMQPTRALWVGNIAPATTPDGLSAMFQTFGTIESARVLNHKNCGFVNFVRLEDAVRAKQAMNGKSIDGSVIRIGYAKVPAAKSESALKLRNPVPSAAPLTASGQQAEAAAITGTTTSSASNELALEPGVSLAINEDLVAFPYSTQLPSLPEPSTSIRTDNHHESSKQRPVLQQSRLRELRRQLDAGMGHSRDDEFDKTARELLPHSVDLCTDYVGNVLIQRLAERASSAQRLDLIKRVAPYMAAIGVHKNGTWAVQKIIDTAEPGEQRRVIVRHLRKHVPQLLLDQLGNYVVQGCLKFGANGNEDESNQFVYDAIHARCLEIAQGRFGARAVRTCLESTQASRLQQKLVSVALVINAAALATNANGHLLLTWLLDASQFPGRFRVLAHQLAPHLRYLVTHKLGASTVGKLVDQTSEPDARDLILNTLFFNPDPSVLEDVLADQAQGIQVVLRILQGSAIGESEKARIADRVQIAINQQRHAPNAAAAVSSTPSSSSSSSSPPGASGTSMQRLSDIVSSILAHSQPVYPSVDPPVTSPVHQDMPIPQYKSPSPLHPAPLGFHHPISTAAAAGGAMSFPVNPNTQQPSAMLPPAGFGGMAVGHGQQMPFYPMAQHQSLPFAHLPSTLSQQQMVNSAFMAGYPPVSEPAHIDAGEYDTVHKN